ncbi:MAG TPA: hypothetical protein VIH71_09300 [Solirubrobacteraceae bacterium]
MSTSALEGADLKIERAKRHLANLKEVTKRAFDPKSYEFRREIDHKTGKHILWADRLPVIAPEWSVVIGEVVFHLRSALDHLAYQLVILDKKIPTCKTQFPIRESTCNKNGKLMPLKGWLMPEIKSKKILAALHECQPYQGGHNDPLWLLRVLNNIDKHRLMLVVVCVLDTDSMWWSSPITPPPDVTIRTGILEQGQPIGCIDFHGLQPPPEFDAHPSFSIAIDEAEAPMISAEPFDGILEQLCRHVEIDIIEQRFRPMFS